MDFSGITGFVTNAASNLTSITFPETSANTLDMLGLLAVFIMMFFALFIIVLFVIIILIIALYVYSSWALMSIAKRAKVEPSWLAWIPFANLYLLSKIARMHWWPILLIIPYFIGIFIGMLLLRTMPVIGILFYVIGISCMIAFAVFCYIWWWKTLEAIGRPGWWILLNLIPLAGAIVFLVLLGIAAWGKPIKK